jgi:hypothetical protein
MSIEIYPPWFCWSLGILGHPPLLFLSQFDRLSPMAPETKPAAPASADDQPAFGWNEYAERINGRFAMIGMISLLLLEFVTHQTFFSWIGWG